MKSILLQTKVSEEFKEKLNKAFIAQLKQGKDLITFSQFLRDLLDAGLNKD